MKMKNEQKAEKAFEEYKKDYLARAFERDFPQIVKLHEDKILAFRKRWDIPSKGLRGEGDFPDWAERVLKKYKGRARSIKNFEIEYYYGVKGFELVDSIPSVLHEEEPRVFEMGGDFRRVFSYEIYKLCKELTLNPEWNWALEYYLIYNEIRSDFIANTGAIVSERITYGEEGEVLDHRASLIFGPKVRQEEINKLWEFSVKPLLKKIAGGWEGETRVKPKFERDLRIFALHKEGKSPRKICEELYIDYENIDEEIVKRAIARMRERTSSR